MSVRTAALSGILAAGLPAGLCLAQPPSGAAPEVKGSTRTATVAELYPVDRMRDPFVKPSGSGSGSAAGSGACGLEDFSIHQLTMKAMMKDPRADFALLGDSCGKSYVFSAGKLYRGSVLKKNVVSGVTGRMVIAQKTLTLQTSDKDVQVLRLGEVEEKESP